LVGGAIVGGVIVGGAAVAGGGSRAEARAVPGAGAGDGTIVVRVEVPAGPADTARFGFSGTLADTPDGRFDLAVDQGKPAQVSFTRPAGTWKVVEDRLPTDWAQTSLNCRSAGGSSLAVVGPSATIRLAPGDVVTCTYVNVHAPGTGPAEPMIRLGTIFDGFPPFPMLTATVLSPQLAVGRTHVGVPMRAGMFAAAGLGTLWWVVARRRELDREQQVARRSRSGAAGASGR
jgi:hypothetical protein